MKKESFKFSNKQLKIVLNVGVAIFAIFLFVKSFIIDTDRKRYNTGLKNIQEENFQGLVIDKGFEKYNHNAAMIYLNDETKFSVFGQFWSKIKIGDSVVKKRGETIITVYRNKEKFILDNEEILN
ncbi:hypothetical protein SAMN05444671_2353 [Flavobacterium sp. CF108]|uniref:hypothetical protein n=1 Tax=unclassified Flavobacterium TaxID=196869 RepID=UPI0008C1B208|nr:MULTISPECIES: hypothetical protein [unclassified Flavobacterium]SEN88711.1 hypothetical protein SAMN04487978_1669 [Flavobacterium sp. fv08]SHH23711.1 hypothetical protein SAMN05444671_2353 [Flavobacterium sp. CF108]